MAYPLLITPPYIYCFLLGFTGPKAEANGIKRMIAEFLRDELGLELSEEKTLITNARSESAHFLGYEIHTLHANGSCRVWWKTYIV
jgi:hypothetical protein